MSRAGVPGSKGMARIAAGQAGEILEVGGR